MAPAAFTPPARTLPGRPPSEASACAPEPPASATDSTRSTTPRTARTARTARTGPATPTPASRGGMPVAFCGTPVVHCTSEPANRHSRRAASQKPSNESNIGSVIFGGGGGRELPRGFCRTKSLAPAVSGKMDRPHSPGGKGRGDCGPHGGGRAAGVRMADILFSQEGSSADVVRRVKRSATLAIPNGGGLDTRSPWLRGAAGKPAASAGGDRTALRMISHRNQEGQVFWGPKEPASPHLVGERPLRRMAAGDPYGSLGPAAEARRSPPRLHPSRTQPDLLGQSAAAARR